MSVNIGAHVEKLTATPKLVGTGSATSPNKMARDETLATTSKIVATDSATSSNNLSTSTNNIMTSTYYIARKVSEVEKSPYKPREIT